MASLTLDTDNCENITADGATLANVGSSKQISYTLLPGKGLDAELTADVKDFEMDAAKQLNDGAGTLSDGTDSLTSSSAAIKQGITNTYNGAEALQSKLSYAGYKLVMQANGLDIDQLQSGNASAINTISGQISELNNSIAQLKSMPNYATNEVYQQQIAQMQAQISSLTQTVILLKSNSAAIGGTEKYLNGVSQGTGELVSGTADTE